jgi:hypothetical protein
MLVEGGIKDKVKRISEEAWTNDDGSQDFERLFILLPKATEITSLDSDNSVFVTELSTMAIP